MDFSKKSKIVVTCHRFLSETLATEIQILGYQPTRVFFTGVELEGSLRDCIKLNLHLRTASQVLFSIVQFGAEHIDDIYERLTKYSWEKLFDVNKTFSITSNVLHESINNSMFANLKVKDAIVDRMREKLNIRPNTSSELEEVVIHLFWKDNMANVYIDTSGQSLARHGYRKLPGKAPMLEALAASTILTSHWDGKTNFINPMCGSGTLGIEAAMIASHTPPSVFRLNYAFMHLLDYNEDWYHEEMDAIHSRIIEKPTVKIILSDISAKAIETATKNTKAAGFLDWIEFQVCSFEDTILPEQSKGVVFFNPEYGERLGGDKELEDIYKGIGDFMKKSCSGYWGYVFSGNLDLLKFIGLKSDRKIEYYNAKIQCKLMEYNLYEGSRKS